MGLAVVLLRRANRRRDYLSAASEAVFCSGVCCANGKGPCITASMASAHPGSLPSLQHVYAWSIPGHLGPWSMNRVITLQLGFLRQDGGVGGGEFEGGLIPVPRSALRWSYSGGGWLILFYVSGDT